MKKMIPLLLVILIVSCKKNNNNTEPPAYEYYQNSFMTRFGNYRLFTKNGEINSPALVQIYKTAFDSFFYDATDSFQVAEFRKFALYNQDSLINISITPAAEARRTITGSFDQFTGNGVFTIPDTNAVNIQFGAYKTMKQQTSAAGDTIYTTPKPVYFIKKVNDTLFLPFTRYVLVSRTVDTTILHSGTFNNVFSPTGYPSLAIKDTLLVQTFELGMKRVN